MTLSTASNANPRQLQAMTTTDGLMLIIVDSRSGKTFTRVKQIVYLIHSNSEIVHVEDALADEMGVREYRGRLRSAQQARVTLT